MIIHVPVHLGREVQAARVSCSRGGRGGHVPGDVVAYIRARGLETCLDHLQRTGYHGTHGATDSEKRQTKGA